MSKFNNDLIATFARAKVSLCLAWQDTRLRYRRSKIGFFWITLSMGIFCLILGIVYRKLFGFDANEYLLFLICGYVCWSLISSLLSKCPETFQIYASSLKDIKVNPIEILLRFLTWCFIFFSRTALIIVFAFIYFGIELNPVMLLAIAIFSIMSLRCAALQSKFKSPVKQRGQYSLLAVAQRA
ncbi:MAG: ABC transporter permease [Candidatus Eutrophobiaceae bacterium]